MIKLTQEEFIEKAKGVHNNKYDYSKVVYINSRSKITITCPTHGDFEQQAGKHLQKRGCPNCNKSKKSSTEEFIEKANNIHNNIYDYSKVIYTTAESKVIINCNIHGEFSQSPHTHLKGSGCPECGNLLTSSKLRLNTEDFIKRSIEIHNNKYNYSKSIYTKGLDKICIICPDHGEFWQKATTHLQGKGCPKCTLKSQTKLYDKLKNDFSSEEILWEASPEWLGTQRFDIYFPKYNIAVEYNGKQHYEPLTMFGGNEFFILQQSRVINKRDKCINNNCLLLEIKYNYNKKDYNGLIDIINGKILESLK